MAVQGYNLEQTGQEVQGALNKIISISPATDEAPGLMSADDKAKLDALPSGADLTADLAGKVDKETGKGLSTNDFTNADKEQVEQAMPLAIQLLMDRTQDMDTIRSGAALGATAYQKPSSGIPGSDLARLRLTGLPLAGEYTAENFQASYCTLEELAKAANGTYQTASYAGMSGTSSGFTMILPLAGGVNAVFGTLSYTVHIYNATTVITVSWQNTGNTVTVTTASIPDVSQFVTRSVNDLANYYLKSETFTKAEVQSLIGAIQQFHYEIYASTSAVTFPASNVLYLIGPTGTGADRYEEYVYSNGWVKIGDTTIDLSGYVTTQALNAALANYTTTADLTTLLAGKQDVISDLATIRTGAGLGSTAYQKPQTGIPASDLASGVIPDVSGKENTSNKVTSLSAQSTDTQYPSAKAVVDYVEEHGGGTDIDTVVVTVDNNTGTPSGTGSVSGSTLSLSFSNLKGATGPQGMQGNTGSSVDYPYELVNNLTTNDATKGLSAAQGVVLDGKVSQLEAKADVIIQTTETPTVNIFDKTAVSENYYVNKSTGGVASLNGFFATDFIPVDSRGVYFNNGYAGGVAIGAAVYDSSKIYRRPSAYPLQVVYQEGDAFVRFTGKTENLDTAMAVAGTAADIPSEYVPYGTIQSYSVKDDVVPFDALAFKSVQTGKNKLNKAEISDGQYIDRNTGAVGNWSANAATPFIPVSKKGLYFNKYYYGGTAIGAAVYDEQKQYLREATNPYIYQDGDGFVRYSMLTEDKDAAQVEEGSVATDYEEYTEKEVIDPTYLPDSTSEGTDTEKAVNVVLPSKLYAVVGDTLQVFFKQCVQAVAPLNYNILVACAKGRQYHRYFEYTPTSGDVGETTLTIYVKNDFGEIVGNGSCTLVTVAVPSSPATTKRILCVGDSLTANGKWPAEAYRRLSGSGGTPSGDGLTNISFVGSMTKDGAGYLGNSGWTWGDYCTQGRPAFRFTVGMGISVNIGAVYSNNSHNYTVIEVSDNGTILCSTSSSSNTPQASGTLTKVSGGGDATIAYSAYVADSQNPFWDYDNNKLTFVPYVNNYCGGSIDEVFVLLGGNGLVNWKNDFSEYVGYMEDFADTLHAEYPSAKLVLMGMQFPSMELMMPGYGASGSLYADTYGILVSIARLREIYKEFAERDEYKDFVSAIDIGCQFDGDYNYPITEKAVNTRMDSKTEPYDNNVLHPGDAGYMQYADAVYRAICAELN